jgi:hypothetical protein
VATQSLGERAGGHGALVEAVGVAERHDVRRPDDKRIESVDQEPDLIDGQVDPHPLALHVVGLVVPAEVPDGAPAAADESDRLGAAVGARERGGRPCLDASTEEPRKLVEASGKRENRRRGGAACCHDRGRDLLRLLVGESDEAHHFGCH